MGEDKKEGGGDRKDGIKKEKGVTEKGVQEKEVKEIKRRNLANEIREEKFIKEEVNILFDKKKIGL